MNGQHSTGGQKVSVEVINAGDTDITFDLYVSWVGAPRSVMFMEHTIHFETETGRPDTGYTEVFFGYGRKILHGIGGMPVGVAIQGFNMQYSDTYDRRDHQVALQTIAVSNVHVTDVSDTTGRGSKVSFRFAVQMEDTDARAKGTITFLVSAMVSEDTRALPPPPPTSP